MEVIEFERVLVLKEERSLVLTSCFLSIKYQSSSLNPFSSAFFSSCSFLISVSQFWE